MQKILIIIIITNKFNFDRISLMNSLLSLYHLQYGKIAIVISRQGKIANLRGNLIKHFNTIIASIFAAIADSP